VATELIHHFRPRGAAIELMKYRGDECLISGPAGTGKSRAALEKLHLMCLLTPGVKALIVRKTAVSLAASAVATYERDVAAQALLDGTVTFFGGSQREPPQYRYSNGSSIALGGMDNPLKIMSTERDVVFAQEATELTVDDWEMITTRLRNGAISFQQIIADCNPQEPTHWLKLRCEAGKTLMLHSRHEDNPRYFHEDGTLTEEGASYIAKLDALTGVRYLRLRKGIWAAAEGVIYEEYDPAVHLIGRFEIPEDWPRFWSVDFGYVHPFVWQDWATDPDGKAILVHEIFRTQRLVEDHARDIRALCGLGPIDPLTGRPHPYAGPEVTGWRAKRPRIILCDHDAEDRATLERHLGWPTRPADKNVKDGLQTTAARFRLAGNGRARLGFMRDAVVKRDQLLADARRPTCTVEELPAYVWNDKGKDEPNKDMDDGMDALRYFVMELDVKVQPRVRFLR
jgi:PBSX family phage terminase large subunit